jgi:hypothetical protein
MDFGTVAAVIRKDFRTLKPFALTLAVAQFVVSAFFHQGSDFPDAVLQLGDSRMHIGISLWIIVATVMPILTAIFIVMLVQQDRATEPSHDWLARPITAGEVVAAKSLMLLAVVLGPALIGNIVYVLIKGEVIDHVLGPTYAVLMECIFMLVVAWLCSSPLQALLAPIALAFFAVVIMTPFVTVLDAMRDASRAEQAVSTMTPMAAPTADAATRVGIAAPVPLNSWIEAGTLLIPQLVLALLAAVVVLWLLLAQRRVAAARLTFLGFFLLSITLITMQITAYGNISTPVALPTLEQRMAAFADNDRNGDGKLDEAEYRDVLAVLGFSNQFDSYWAQRDADRDGFITEEEFRPPVQ